MFWIKKTELNTYKLADGFETMFDVFENDNLSEMMLVEENGNWEKKIY